MISEEKQIQSDMRLRHELYVKPVIIQQQMVMTGIHRPTTPEITTMKLDMHGIARKILLFTTQEQEQLCTIYSSALH